ncbi:M4 family metallopeptidase [Catellatospora sp. KI3]|uniref:M4 family metallopeptidase n=1 Tax=Catellatospora sp. KI3 TaxID=3041620 RepID=UPI0024828AA2|nr:M4 family metallopeptidase [Catellatospora sp. KI3]MDI1462947.1 M4 family metallopeptidase [Catellatospora sp. KI3]
MSRRAIVAAAATVATALGAAGIGLAQAHADTATSVSAGISQVRLDPAARERQLRQAGAEATSVAKQLGLGPAERLVAKDVVVDSDGSRHLRFDRTYAGLPVVGGDLVVHLAPGGGLTASDWAAAVRGAISLPTTTPKLTRQQAAAAAPGHARHARKPRAATPDLVVFASMGAPVLAYRTTVDGTDAAGNLAREAVITDAASGAVLGGYELLHEVQGTGNSLLVGQVSIDTTLSGGSYTMTDPVRGNTKIYDSHGASENNPSSGATLYTDSDNVWGNGAKTDRATVGVDVNYGLAKTWDYYKETFGRSGIRGDGVGARAYAHVGSNLLNAYWQDSCFCMVFGDGNSSNQTTPLASLDVAGHELTHGVTSNTAGLVYSGESGGLNESTSDIFGTVVEFYTANSSDPGDYYIGEKINWNSGNAGALRRMDDPTLDGNSKGCWYSGVGNLDVHYSSGIGNHFFYLLSEGSGSKTIGGRAHNGVTCNSSTVAGIGRDKAARIWYRALTTYMTSNTNYAAARTASLNAAKDLYGATSVEYWQVSVAWAACSVGTALPSPTTSPTASPSAPSSPSPSASPSTPPTSPSPSPTGNPGTNVIVNGDFEAGMTGWTGSQIIVTNAANAHGGSRYAWILGNGFTATEYISQNVTVPTTGTATLSFYLNITTQEWEALAYDYMRVQINGTTKLTYSNLNAGGGYQLRTLDLSAYRGQTVTLRFYGTEDSNLATAFNLDDVSLS